MDPTFGSTHVGGPRVLTQHQEGEKTQCAAKAVVACMFLRLEKSVCAEIQSIQMEYTWLNILYLSAVVAEIMKI